LLEEELDGEVGQLEDRGDRQDDQELAAVDREGRVEDLTERLSPEPA
jgi:hypothetical protein